MSISKITAASITDNTITNTQINSSAAIAKTKLAALNIVNADINASAAIAQSKMAALASSNLPAGSILQVQSTTSNTEVADTSGNYNGSLLEVNITPTATSSKILVLVDFYTGYFNPNGAFRLNRAISGGATTSLAHASNSYDGGSGFLAMDDVAGYGTNGNIANYVMHSWAFNHLDSPSTTSQVTYKLQANSIYSMYFNRTQGANYGHASSTITAMELKQ